MSQAGIVDVEGSHPQIPTSFVTNMGTAIPIANVLEILGTTVAAHSIPLETTGSGNTVTIEVQFASAAASSIAANAGVASFNSAQFTVDANGFVSSTGGGSTETLTGNSGGAVSPTANNINTIGTGSITIAGNPGTSTLTTQLTGLTNHAVLVGAGTPTITNVGPTATAGQIFQSQGATTDPAFSTATYPSTTTVSQILYSSATNVVSGLATANNGVLITSATGVPSILPNGTTNQVLTATTSSPASWKSISSTGAIITIDGDTGSMTPTAGVVTISGGTTGLTTSASVSTMNLGGILNLANGGTSANLTANNGGIFYSNATTGAILAGTTTALQMLQSGASSAPAWSTATWPATVTTPNLLYASATNVVGQVSSNNRAVLTSNTSSVPAWRALNDGQIIIGSTAGNPLAANISAGTGISITNGANTITIAVNGAVVGQTITGNTGGALSPTAGNWNIVGTSTAAGTTPVQTSGATSTLTIQVQKTQAIASTNATNVGLAAFNSAQFTVDANGFVGLFGGTGPAIQTITTQTFTTSGTYTPTTGMQYCIIQVVGGGGGSAGVPATSAGLVAGAGSGGGGGYARGRFTAATIGASQTVTIGAGGAGGATGANVGSPGGTTSVGALISATGGGGGDAGSASTVIMIAGGAGGAGTGGDFQTVGTPGGISYGSPGALFVATAGGGSSFFGGGGSSTGIASTVGTSVPPVAGTSYGGGATGGASFVNTSGQAGAAGFKGIVIITEFNT